MFEDSTFESTGSIHTRSRGWMFATFALNGAVVMALILFPLLYPTALPRVRSAILMVAPPPQETPPPPPPPQQMARVPHVASEMMNRQIIAPRLIPKTPYIPSRREPPRIDSVANWNADANGPGNGMSVFSRPGTRTVVREAKRGPARVSSGVMEGLLIQKILPVYPAMAQAMGVGGTVVLEATITKEGTIADLRVVRGPALLQRAAEEAVSRWRYRPYLLNGEPVEVETTVNVEFTMH